MLLGYWDYPQGVGEKFWVVVNRGVLGNRGHLALGTCHMASESTTKKFRKGNNGQKISQVPTSVPQCPEVNSPLFYLGFSQKSESSHPYIPQEQSH